MIKWLDKIDEFTQHKILSTFKDQLDELDENYCGITTLTDQETNCKIHIVAFGKFKLITRLEAM